MAKSPITGYPIADAITGEEWLVLVQAAVTKRVTASNLMASEIAVHAALPGAHQDLVTLEADLQFLLSLSDQALDFATLASGDANKFAASPDGAGGKVSMRAIAPDDMPLALESEPGAVELATVAEAVAMTAGTVITAQRLRNAAPAAPAAELIVCLDPSGHLIMPAAGEVRVKTGYSVGITGSDERIEFYDDSRVAVMGAVLGVGVNSPDGVGVHIMSGDASVTVNAAADELCVEGTGPVGISIMGADAQDLNLYWASASDNIGARATWNHDANLFEIGPSNADGELSLLYGTGNEGVRLDSVGQAGFGITPARMVDIAQANDGASTGVRLSNSDTNGTPSTDESVSWQSALWRNSVAGLRSAGTILIGKDDDWSTSGKSDSYMSLSTSLSGTLTEHMRITSAGRVGIGAVAPASILELNLATQDLEIVDAGNAGATEQAWVEVEVAGVQGFLRVYAAV